MPTDNRIAYFGRYDDIPAPAELFGNKTAKLSELSGTGLRVPPGFTFGISLCTDYYEKSRNLPEWYHGYFRKGINYLEELTGKRLNSRKNPLIVSVRSGAPVSMPGIMETILNAGINRNTIEGIIFSTGNPAFAWDTYRRFLESFGCTALGHSRERYKKIIRRIMSEEGLPGEKYLAYDELRSISEEYESLYSSNLREGLLAEPGAVIEQSVKAVLDSWDSSKTAAFKRLNPETELKGTAVTIQAMVFGNISRKSGAGVAFTRNPWTGENKPVIDFQFGCQGEDIVSGYFTGVPVGEIDRKIPGMAEEIIRSGKVLEDRFKDMQDFEFTVEREELFILQTRNGKRAPLAAVKIACDLVEEGKISEAGGLELTDKIQMDKVCTEMINTSEKPAGHGDSASLGAVSGRIAFSRKKAEAISGQSPVILVKDAATPDDIDAISFCKGILTKRGAVTSHAAVVAREMGRICIVNCNELKIIPEKNICTIGDFQFREGDYLTLDGRNGSIYAGIQEIIREKPEELMDIINKWKENSS